MKCKEYPSQDTLLTYFLYDNGFLRWKIKKSSNTVIDSIAGHVKDDGYSHVIIDGQVYQIHRIIYIMFNGVIPSNLVIDHEDGNPSNNLIGNLQVASQSLNNAKRKIGCNNTSGYKGVTWNKRANKWQAQIGHNKKIIHLGNHNCPTKAALAYDTKAKELYGKFAFQNLPLP